VPRSISSGVSFATGANTVAIATFTHTSMSPKLTLDPIGCRLDRRGISRRSVGIGQRGAEFRATVSASADGHTRSEWLHRSATSYLGWRQTLSALPTDAGARSRDHGILRIPIS